MDIERCGCGWVPRLAKINRGQFTMIVVNCDVCKTTSRARLSDQEAIQAWNDGLRNDADGYPVMVLSPNKQ